MDGSTMYGDVRELAIAYADAKKRQEVAQATADGRAAALLGLDDEWVEASLDAESAARDVGEIVARLQALRPDQELVQPLSFDFGTVRVTYGKEIESVSLPADAARALLASDPALAEQIGVERKTSTPAAPTITVRKPTKGAVDGALAGELAAAARA